MSDNRTGKPEEQARLDQLAALIKKGDIDWRGAELAGSLGEAALPLTLTALDDPDPDVRASAVFILGSLHVPAAVPAIQRAFKDAYPEVRFRAARACGTGEQNRMYLPELISDLVPLLKDDSSRVQWGARETLSEISEAAGYDVVCLHNLLDPPVLQALLDEYSDKDKIEIEQVLGSLARGGLPFFLSALNQVHVGENAVGIVTASLARPSLLPRLIHVLKFGRNPDLQVIAAAALEKIGDPAGLAAVEEWRGWISSTG